MTQQRGLTYSGIEQIVDVDLNAMQDRIYLELQRRMMSLLGLGLPAGLEESRGQIGGLFTQGVLSGLGLSDAGTASFLDVKVAAGEAVVMSTDPGDASGESRFRLVRVSPNEGVPVSRIVRLDAAHATYGRIDAITVQPAVVSLAGDTYSVPKKVASIVDWVSATKRSRTSAQLTYYPGTASASPQPPTIPNADGLLGEILLGYVWVPASATGTNGHANLRFCDKRLFAQQHLAFAQLDGLLSGFELSIGTSATSLRIAQGVAAVDGQLSPWPVRAIGVAPTAGAYEIDWKTRHDAGDSATAGWRYVYLNVGQGTMLDGADRIVVSNTAPSAVTQGPSTGLAYTSTQNPIKAYGAGDSAGLYLGRIWVDGTNITIAISAADDRAGGELHAGVATYSGVSTHSGRETHTAADTHTGDEMHHGAEVHNGAESHLGAETHGAAETHIGDETHSGAEVHSGDEVHHGAEVHLGQESFPVPTVATSPVRASDGAPVIFSICIPDGGSAAPNTNYYLPPGMLIGGMIQEWNSGGMSWLQSAGVGEVPVPVAMKLSHLFVSMPTPVTGAQIQVWLMVNGAPSVLNINLTVGQIAASETALTVTVNAGDRIGFRIFTNNGWTGTLHGFAASFKGTLL